MMTKQRYSPYFSGILFGLDFIVLFCLFFAFLFVHDQNWDRSFHGLLIFGKVHYKSLILIGLSWVLISSQTNLYGRARFSRLLEILKRIFFQIILFAVVLYAVSGGKSENLYSSNESLYFVLILMAYLLVSRTSAHYLLQYFRTKGFNQRKVIVVGDNDNSDNLIQMLNDQKHYGLRMDFHFSKEKCNKETIANYLSINEVDYAYICLGNELNESQIAKLTELFEDHYVNVGFIPSVALETQQNLEINYLDAFPILTYKKYPLDFTFNRVVKRIFDIVFTLLVFATLLWWLLPLLALAVYFSQGAPILFAQKRNGLNGREFDCLKFRTMRPDKDNNKKATERNDPRVTKLGKILRKTSLDELPQFFNVLKGDMSIVGPRPHMVSENESYSTIINRYALRHYVKPGITGLAQVKGYRGAVDTDRDMEMRIRTDIYYVRNWSFLLDLFIIYKTAKLMVVGDENAI